MNNYLQNKELIESARREIRMLSNHQDSVYQDLIRRANLKDDDYLWDYVFNCHGEDEYTERMRKEIYG